MIETGPLGPDTEMVTVTSTDGAEIAFERTGNGPPLVLVHGGIGDHRFWDLSGVRPALADHFTMYAMGRRGCGESEVPDSYAKEREAEDIAAVGVIDGPATLLGHSLGSHLVIFTHPTTAVRRLHGGQ